MTSITVPLGERTYRIQFGELAKAGAATVKAGIKPCSALLITTEAVRRAGYAQVVARSLKRSGFSVTVGEIPNGERHKNSRTLSKLYSEAVRAHLDRRSVVVALGGGVVTDLSGFLAATYMRGISFVSIPTTLLAMVDAAIGGKTGIDLPEGKNLVGAFWQPKLVWIDQTVLRSLPAREWKTGFAEVIKYGVIRDKSFFKWVEDKSRENSDVRRWKAADIARAIHTSAAIKAEVVSRDERETPMAGGREILNFGHTFGHALEAATGYHRFTHGEAISIGMIAAGRLSREFSLWSDDEQLQLLSLFDAVGLPVRCASLPASQRKSFWKALSADKKNVDGKLRFVLPETLGRVILKSGVTKAQVSRALGW